MTVNEIPAQGWEWFVIVALVLMNLFNQIITVRKNAREEKHMHDEPMVKLSDMVKNHQAMLDRDKRKLDDHDSQLSDLKNGMMVMCQGVQALLEHELHNGNGDQMQEASNSLNKWLRDRP